MGFHFKLSLVSLSRDMGSLSQAAAERYVLAGNFVEHDQQIVRRDSSSRHHSVIQCLQQSQPLVLRTSGDERDLQYNQVVRIFEAQERRRMTELASRQN